MAVTITIRNNDQFCVNHKLVRYDAYDCGCDRNPRCPDCGGAGEIRFPVYPFSLNVANGNFATLWSALGFDADVDCGSMDGRALAAALRNLDPALLIRADRASETPDGPRVYWAGIVGAQADRYIEILSAIADEAQRREELVIWY